MLKRLILTWVIALTGPVTWAAEDWPEFRGPTGQGISTAKDVPIEWNATRNIVWKTEIPGTGWSSPVVVDGRIYLTSGVGRGGGQVSLRALCVDAAKSDILWNVEVFKPAENESRVMHQKNSLASATPIVSGGKVYVHFGHMGTAALDLTGKVLWRQTTLKFSSVHGNGGSPALVGKVLVINCDGARDPFVAGLNADNGTVKWRTPRRTPAKAPFSFSTPLAIDVDGQTQLISAGSGFVAGYEPETGKEIWRVRYGEGYSVVPRPVYAHGLLFVSSGFDQAVMYAIRPAGAKGDATDTHVAWTHRKGAPNTPSPLVVGDEVYWISDVGIATCADARTGQVHWTQRLDGNFSASPLAADGRLFFQNEKGMGYVMRAGTTAEVLAENDLGEPSLASHAAIDGALFVRTARFLWRIGKER